jgi:hypothetical protein
MTRYTEVMARNRLSATWDRSPAKVACVLISSNPVSEKKVELAELLEEKMFRSEQGIKFEMVRKIINGVEQTILVVKLKLRPPRTVEER